MGSLGPWSGGVIPVPIPNTVVKPTSAEDTRDVGPRENRSGPGSKDPDAKAPRSFVFPEVVMRAQAPRYRGEGPHALWHVSEDPAITRFAPHRAKTALTDELLVWAVDTRHLPLFWYPRDCPRCTFWAGPCTTDADTERFLEGRRDRAIHVIEDRWLERLCEARLYLYRMPQESFIQDPEVAGYWTSHETMEPLEVLAIDDLIGRLSAAGIPLRTESNLWPLWDAVVASTLEFSGIRLRNALARTEPSAG